jgi:hypothetical protein
MSPVWKTFPRTYDEVFFGAAVDVYANSSAKDHRLAGIGGGVGLPARMGFSICRRYVQAGSMRGRAGVDR